MGIPARAKRISETGWFTTIVFTTIVVNAVAIGAETYEGFERDNESLLEWVNHACLAIFVIEITVRIAAYGSRPQDFFRSGWNVFDFAIVFVSFVPGLGQDTTVLRLVRLARIVRLVSLLPDLRVLLVAIGRSVPPIASMGVMAVLVIYVYGIVGWILFHEEIPDRWGDIGTAMLTLFVMLSLENLPDNMDRAMEVHSASWIYFVSYALTASFLLLNVLIGIIINSMEEAREIEHTREREERRDLIAHADDDHEIDEQERTAMLAERIESIRDALDELADEIGSPPPSHFAKRRGRGGKDQT